MLCHLPHDLDPRERSLTVSRHTRDLFSAKQLSLHEVSFCLFRDFRVVEVDEGVCSKQLSDVSRDPEH